MSDRPVFADTIDLRVFWEGVRFPYVESLNIRDQPQKSTCRMSVPRSHRLKSEDLVGTHLHVFYANKLVREKFGPDPGPKSSSWPILFEGQMAGESHNDSVSSQKTQFTFVGNTRHFDQTTMFYLNPNRDSNSAQELSGSEQRTLFMGQTEIKMNASQTKIINKAGQIFQTLKEKVNEEKQKSGSRNIAFQAVALEVLRAAKKSHPYLDYIDRKLRLTERFAAFEDPDLHKIITLQGMEKIVGKRVENLGNSASLMDALNLINNILKYDWNHITQPQLQSTGEDNLNETAPGISEANESVIRDVISLTNKVKNGVHSGEQTISIGVSDQDVFVSPLIDNVEEVPPKNFARILKNELLESPDRDPALVVEETMTYVVPEDGDDLKIDQFLDDANPEGEGSTSEFLAENDKLNEFAVTPNMSFSQPPKCNVFLPHNITKFGINKNELQEPTRMLAKMTRMKGKDGNIREWYLAPFAQSFYHMEDGNLNTFSAAYDEYTQEINEDFNLATQDEEGEQ